MEDLVEIKFKELILNEKMCKCAKCEMDIISLALNNLPPRYVVTNIGALYTRLNELVLQFSIDVTVEVLNAIKMVKCNPQHEQELHEQID